MCRCWQNIHNGGHPGGSRHQLPHHEGAFQVQFLLGLQPTIKRYSQGRRHLCAVSGESEVLVLSVYSVEPPWVYEHLALQAVWNVLARHGTMAN